ncbi:MAG: cytochrome c oxidase subunit 3 [Phycisphaerae bacterium]|nr:cytochrome c oxidase subunit 3 [Phycisphaerae bacterium]
MQTSSDYASPHGSPQTVPKRAGMIGMVIFLAALTMLFLAALLGFVIIRISQQDRVPHGALSMPMGLWFSSFAIIAASITVEMACGYIRRERQRGFRVAMVVSLLLTLVFIAIQAPSLWILLERHWARRSAESFTLYGLVFVVILLHAAHVLGGVFPLTVTTVKAFRHDYDHEHWQPVRYAAMYWHFLAVVWIVTFATFLILQ